MLTHGEIRLSITWALSLNTLSAILRQAAAGGRKLPAAFTSSLVVRLTVYGVCLVIVGSIVKPVVLSAVVSNAVEERTQSYQISLASYIARDIDQKLIARTAVLASLAAEIRLETPTDPLLLKLWTEQREADTVLFSGGVAILDASTGRPLAATAAPAPMLPEAPAGAEWFRAAIDGHFPVIARPLRDPASGRPILTVAVALRDPAGRPLAVLAGVTVLDAGSFLDLLQQSRVGRIGGFMLVAPEDRLIIAGDHPELAMTPLPPAGADTLLERAVAGFRGAGRMIGGSGREELAAVASIPATGWFLIAHLPLDEALAPLDALWRYLIVQTAVVILVLCAVSYLLLRRVLRPLWEAAWQMHRMADGKEPLAPLPVYRRDEVGELAAGFNYLLGKLREQEAALRASETRMAHLAQHDPLTDLPNRALFQDRLRQTLAQAERTGGQFAVMYADLDGFKLVNDRFGHAVGDELLKAVAGRLSEMLRRSDTLARLGGDEFAVVLAVQEDAAAASQSVARKCREAIARPFAVDGLTLSVGLSVGVAVYPTDGRDARTLLLHADQAMYAVKRGAGMRAD